MSANKFTDEFKRDAVAQVADRGYPVREVAERLPIARQVIAQQSPRGASCTMICATWAKISAPTGRDVWPVWRE